MQESKKKYTQLSDLSKKSKLLESITSLLHWDQETYMPEKGIGVRAEQLELLASLHHKECTSNRFAKILGKLIDLKSGAIFATDLSFDEQAALKRWRLDYLKAKALTNSFVKKFARLNAESINIWAKARKENNFKLFAPQLKKTIQMSRKKAAQIDSQKPIYDVLIDIHEPEMTQEVLSGYFAQVKPVLLELIKNSPKNLDRSFLEGNFSKEKQLQFGNFLLGEVGYDLTKGRLDLSNHPFSISLHPFDSRITTRITTNYLFDSLSAVMHEAGHSLYEMGLNEKAYGTPICEALSLGIHESQSRLYETIVGQSKPFWAHYFPKLQETFAPQLDEVTLDQFYKAINRVRPSLIRVEADELTYSLHVLIRFEIEKVLLDGTLDVRELPKAWNGKMKEYLGVEPQNDAEGCLQDIHWAMGEFGYFPTYFLGNLYAAQFFEAFKSTNAKEDDYMALKGWLNENVHKQGRIYTATELVKRVTGKELSPAPYLNYLTQKYSRFNLE